MRNRVSERQADVDRGLMEQRAEEERRARKTAGLAEQLKAKEVWSTGWRLGRLWGLVGSGEGILRKTA